MLGLRLWKQHFSFAAALCSVLPIGGVKRRLKNWRMSYFSMGFFTCGIVGITLAMLPHPSGSSSFPLAATKSSFQFLKYSQKLLYLNPNGDTSTILLAPSPQISRFQDHRALHWAWRHQYQASSTSSFVKVLAPLSSSFKLRSFNNSNLFPLV